MDKDLPIYRMVIDPDKEDSGVDYIALVDSPAIGVTWFQFNHKEQFAINEERKIIVSPAMIPELKIYRRNEKMGEFYVIFDKEQINIMQEKFMSKNYINNVNEMHDGSKKLDGIIMKNSWVSDASMGIKGPEMFSDLPDGTWYISYKFQDDDMWNEFVKSGNFKGVSVEGMFDLVPYKETFEDQFLKILNQITQY
jgi:hypothetical protein